MHSAIILIIWESIKIILLTQFCGHLSVSNLHRFRVILPNSFHMNIRACDILGHPHWHLVKPNINTNNAYDIHPVECCVVQLDLNLFSGVYG